ncbi:MAG: indolepyruvate ferredoxin oxidoreductase family protein [Myxococcota bacterium]
MSETAATVDLQYALEDRYRLERGRVFLTGNQALVRLPLMQRQRDLAAGLNTAGFISGYRGSPLGTYDMALWQAKGLLEEHHIHFEPGVNEDLAATAVWGSQQANLLEGARYDGVFGVWYGKGPGVDRSGDALKHGNFHGSASHGGVLALCGDDPGAQSSSLAHQSEHALISFGMPILNPANVQDYLDFGILGWALSRYSGCWVGFKCLTDTVESTGSVAVDPDRVGICIPEDFELPAGGLNIRYGSMPTALEERLFVYKLPAAQAFARANGLDRTVLDGPRRRLGIVTTGKAYLDVRQALDELGIDEARAADLGLSIYKVGMSWPLEAEGARAFADGLEEILVIEEKRPVIEEQLASLLYNLAQRPRLLGKQDAAGRPLLPSVGELDPDRVVQAVGEWLARNVEGFEVPACPGDVVTVQGAFAGLTRLPSFCSGCPHNTSTVVPEGSVAMGGIGCHGMAVWLPERRTLAVGQMGGEGAAWIGQAPFTDTPHIFQNLGDGTYFHSGLLAIRAAVTANVNITYKILVNGAVAMTGGQPIEGEPMDGDVTTPEIVKQLDAEGVRHIAVLSDDIEKYPNDAFPAHVDVLHRDELIRVQQKIRHVEGVSAIVFDQTCAAEARRLRKRGEFPDPDRRIVINEAVCEGCGDCSVVSNCISIEPVETEFGRKRKINQSSCNKDFSCVKGYCPSFASITGGSLRKRGAEAIEIDDRLFEALPDPGPADASRPFNLYVAGIGGTGVITVGALLGMAAHLEGKGCLLLDVTGLAQKNGPVASHVRIADDPEALHATRIGKGAADLVLGCDVVVTAGGEGLSRMSPERTTAVVNSHVAPTADFATSPDLDLSADGMKDAIGGACGDGAHFVAATKYATALLGDAIGSNLFLLGYAYQIGRLPVSLAALERAVELNGRSVDMNKRAIAWGRLAAHDLDSVEKAARPGLQVRDDTPQIRTLEDLVAHRMGFLTDYQSPAYAVRYRELVDRVTAAEQRIQPGSTKLAEGVARYYAKLMAYKDEYEVARLYTDGAFRQQIESEFEGDYKIQLHLAPQVFFAKDPDTGRPRKLSVGPWMLKAFAWLAPLKFLRGTRLDPFGWPAHRRLERQLIVDYEKQIGELLDGLSSENLEIAVEIAGLPEGIRGFADVKEQHLEAVRVKQTDLLESFQRRAR